MLTDQIRNSSGLSGSLVIGVAQRNLKLITVRDGRSHISHL